MLDDVVRALERHGARPPAEEARLLMARVRAGRLPLEHLEAAARLGSPLARLALGERAHGADAPGPHELGDEAIRLGPRAVAALLHTLVVRFERTLARSFVLGAYARETARVLLLAAREPEAEQPAAAVPSHLVEYAKGLSEPATRYAGLAVLLASNWRRKSEHGYVVHHVLSMAADVERRRRLGHAATLDVVARALRLSSESPAARRGTGRTWALGVLERLSDLLTQHAGAWGSRAVHAEVVSLAREPRAAPIVRLALRRIVFEASLATAPIEVAAWDDLDLLRKVHEAARSVLEPRRGTGPAARRRLLELLPDLEAADQSANRTRCERCHASTLDTSYEVAAALVRVLTARSFSAIVEDGLRAIARADEHLGPEARTVAEEVRQALVAHLLEIPRTPAVDLGPSGLDGALPDVEGRAPRAAGAGRSPRAPRLGLVQDVDE